jgi:predicted dehydrogenase
MVGGGPDAFIGAVHRMAVALDGTAVLVAGAFSSDPARSKEQGARLWLDPKRTYASWQEMVEREAALPEDERLDFVSIVTPNHLHYPVARAFIEAGFHVVCDKPMTTTVEDAESLCRLVAAHGCVFALTHNYAGYPMVKEARAIVARGGLGAIRKVFVEYTQGWLATLLEASGQKQASWRTDPTRAGISSALGDIGSHAEHLVRYITGLRIEELCADVSTLVPNRTLEDDASLLLHYEGGARGVLSASQICVGDENNLRVRVYGTEASLVWAQEDPNYLYYRHADRPAERLTRGSSWLAPAAANATRLPTGHPEAFIEGFANVYRGAASAIARARDIPGADDAKALDFPTVQDGAVGVHFIHTAIASGRERKWVDARYDPPTS